MAGDRRAVSEFFILEGACARSDRIEEARDVVNGVVVALWSLIDLGLDLGRLRQRSRLRMLGTSLCKILRALIGRPALYRIAFGMRSGVLRFKRYCISRHGHTAFVSVEDYRLARFII